MQNHCDTLYHFGMNAIGGLNLGDSRLLPIYSIERPAARSANYVRRVRRNGERRGDAPPDTGCHLHPRCLSCPRDICIYDTAKFRRGAL